MLTTDLRTIQTLMKAALIPLFLVACGSPLQTSRNDSLTGYDFVGQKYYLGFAELLTGFMGNETRYDVLHTHDIFTSGQGGNYDAVKLIDQAVSGATVRRSWIDIKGKITTDDMYVQYSSGHGSEEGLGIGLSYREIRDNALAFGAKETIIFTMSCFSGNLIDAFDERKEQWRNFADSGRSLFVMTSSTSSQESGTGPHTDGDEPAGVDGSAGSAFGHALWKALIGYADGAADGVSDGLLTLEEIESYVKSKTHSLNSEQDPVVIGSYDPQLVMATTPTRAYRMQQERESRRAMGDEKMETSITGEE